MDLEPITKQRIPEGTLPTGRTFCCPGETVSISESVHLGRLASGWSGCTECTWRNDGVNRPKRSSDAIRQQFTGSEIRRTEFGVRGAYLNAVDRLRGAQLASIFSTHLANVSSEVARQRHVRKTIADDQSLKDIGSEISMAVGYDGCQGSADIFSGVVSAILQNGCNVVDAGRSTAASLLHVSRRYPHLCGSLLVTGADGQSGDIGLDVFDPHGHGVAVPWQKFGVSVRIQNGTDSSPWPQNETPDGLFPAEQVDTRLRDLRSIAKPADLPPQPTLPTPDTTIIQLPKLHESAGQIFRSSRRSGSLTAVPAEKYYLEWLLRWWPVHSRQSVRFVVNGNQSSQRLEWLAQHCSLNLEVRTKRPGQSAPARGSGPEGVVSFELHEDDRFLTVRSRRGRVVPAEELSVWMNRFMPPTSSHVTAHATSCGRRVLLVDVATPDTGNQQQVISDGLAVAGWIVTCMANGENPLPL